MLRSVNTFFLRHTIPLLVSYCRSGVSVYVACNRRPDCIAENVL